jgi:two-component system KDP operon response regulator KdpE
MTSEQHAKNLPRILVIDDELAIRRFLHTVLTNEGFAVYEAEGGHAGLAAVAGIRPEIVLLDLGLPDLDGIEVIKRLREWSQVAIIVISVREREDDKIKALNAGADDYLTKPFGVGELLARIRASLRRSQQKQSPDPVFKSGDLAFDQELRRVTVRGEIIQLTPIEYDLLRLLVNHADKVLTHSMIMKQIWGTANQDQPHLLRVNISNLRRKIEADPSLPRHIVTEPGVGYRLTLAKKQHTAMEDKEVP